MIEHQILTFDDLYQNGNWRRVPVNCSKKEVINNIGLIEKEVAKPVADFHKLKEYFYLLISKIPLSIQYFENPFLLRARPNENGEVFKHQTEVSYNTLNKDKILCGRFNLRKESLFYSTLPYSTETSSGQLACIVESYKDIYKEGNTEIRKYFTVSKWKINRKFKACNLSFYDVAINKNINTKDLAAPISHFLDNAVSSEDREKCFEFYSFISRKAGVRDDSENNYKLTAAFYHSLRKCYGNDIGIVYSSAMSENNDLNIVLTPEIVDSCLELENIGMFVWTPDRNVPKTGTIVPCSSLADVDKEGYFRLLNIT